MSIKDMVRMENQLDEVADEFGDMMKQAFDEDPKIFEGHSTKASWNAQVAHASDELRKELNAMIERFETRLHQGEFA
tara:strand:- start:1475 stop:1705 length:231 start_codon:yes stop_codon:yes gene_type:complete